MVTKTAAKTTAVAEKAENAVASFSNDVPDYLKGKTGSRGSEEVQTKDMVLPRLEIVQSQSPIKDDGAEEGHLFNSATMEQLGDIAYFVPVYFRTEYLIWKDQDEGGGFFGAYMTEAEANVRRNEVISEGEDEEFIEVVDTPVHYGLLVYPDGSKSPSQIVISMAKSKAKVSRKWNSVIQIVGGDRFSRVYKISTFKDKNKQNKTFYNFVVQPAGFVPEEVYALAEQTYLAFKKDGVRANHESVINQGEFPSNGGDPIDRAGI